MTAESNQELPNNLPHEPPEEPANSSNAVRAPAVTSAQAKRRMPRAAMAIFVLLFAAVGTYFIWKGFASPVSAPTQTTQNGVVDLQGTLNAYVEDNFKDSKEAMQYQLHTADGKSYELDFPDKSQPELLSGSKVKVHGQQVNSGKVKVASDAGTDFQVIQAAQPHHSPRKVAVIPINFTNDRSQPFTTDQMKAIVYNAMAPTSSQLAANNGWGVSSYYLENSYGERSLVGKTDPTGDVFAWQSINYDNSGCQIGAWDTAAQASLTAQGVDLSGYDHYIYVFPHASSCLWEGNSEIGGSDSWHNGDFGSFGVAHELGHNFGLQHSNSVYNCTDVAGKPVSFSDNCASLEYGDPYSVMGSALNYQFNMYEKTALLWQPPNNTQTITTNGIYTIYPLEQPTTQVTSLRIPRYTTPTSFASSYTLNSSFFYIDYRQPYGYDDFTPNAAVSACKVGPTNGVMLYYGSDTNQITHDFLINSTPVSDTGSGVYNYSFCNPAFPPGSTFNDPKKGITVKVLSANSTDAQVQVSISPDTTPPSKPTGLAASGITSNSVGLKWTAATDNVGVAAYWIYQVNGKVISQVATSTVPAVTITNLASRTAYKFYVVAVDAAGNQSAPSTAVSAKTH